MHLVGCFIRNNTYIIINTQLATCFGSSEPSSDQYTDMVLSVSAHIMGPIMCALTECTTGTETCCQLCINDYICVAFDWINYFIILYNTSGWLLSKHRNEVLFLNIAFANTLIFMQSTFIVLASPYFFPLTAHCRACTKTKCHLFHRTQCKSWYYFHSSRAKETPVSFRRTHFQTELHNRKFCMTLRYMRKWRYSPTHS
jgi:hypothetical protein